MGADTSSARRAMIDAAERLIALQGPGAVSMRMIGQAAGQGNHGAVQLHFGSLDGLLTAIASERMGRVNRARSSMIDALARDDRLHDVTGLVEALVRPLVACTLERPGSHYARFLAASYADPRWAGVVRPTAEGAAFAAWRGLLEQALVGTSPALRRLRVDQIITTVITALAHWEGGTGRRGMGTRACVDDLILTCTAFATASPNRPLSGPIHQEHLDVRSN